MKKVICYLMLLCLVIINSKLQSQTCTVKTLPESIIPVKHRLVNTILKNEDSTVSIVWMNSTNTILEPGTFMLQHFDKKYNEIKQNIVVNNATPDDKRIPVPFAFKNKDIMLIGSSHYFTGGYSDLISRGLKCDYDGKISEAPIEYIKTDGAVWSYVGLMPHYVFSENRKYYACIYTSYSRASPNDGSRRIYVKLFDENNKVLYTNEKITVGEVTKEIEYFARKYKVSNTGEVYLAVSKEVNRDIKSILIYHYDVSGKLLGTATIDNANSAFKDYNIGISNTDLIITGVTQETKLEQKSAKRSYLMLKKFFYAKFNGTTNAVETYVESDMDLQKELVNNENLTVYNYRLCDDCIRIRDVIPNGKNTWIIGEKNVGTEYPNVGSLYSTFFEILVFNLDENGKLTSISKLKRKLATSVGNMYDMSTFFDDVFKTYRYQVYNNNLYIFYNAEKNTKDIANIYEKGVTPHYIENNGSADAAGFVSKIDVFGNQTPEKNLSSLGECFILNSYTAISENKIVLQLGRSKKIAEVTLE